MSRLSGVVDAFPSSQRLRRIDTRSEFLRFVSYLDPIKYFTHEFDSLIFLVHQASLQLFLIARYDPIDRHKYDDNGKTSHHGGPQHAP